MTLSPIIILQLIIMILVSGPCFSETRDDLSVREYHRRVIPVDKLKIFLEAPKRIQIMQPERVMDVLGVSQGNSIADIGAGTGFFSFPLARRVGFEGNIYAVEIEDELLDFIRQKMKQEGITNIVPIKSSASGPQLPAACCDKVLMVNTYNYFDQPVTFMENLRPALKPGGSVGIIDVDGEQTGTDRKLLVRNKWKRSGEIIEEMKIAGYEFREAHDFLQSRFFLVFSRSDQE